MAKACKTLQTDSGAIQIELLRIATAALTKEPADWRCSSPHGFNPESEKSAMVRMNRIVQVLLLGGLVVLQGCMFTTLRNELREMEHARVLTPVSTRSSRRRMWCWSCTGRPPTVSRFGA